MAQPVSHIRIDQNIKRNGKYRHRHGQQHPAELDTGVPLPADLHQGHHHRQQHRRSEIQLLQPYKCQHQQHDLHRQQQDDHTCPAKYQVDDALLAFVQQQHRFLLMPEAFFLRHGDPLPFLIAAGHSGPIVPHPPLSGNRFPASLLPPVGSVTPLLLFLQRQGWFVTISVVY